MIGPDHHTPGETSTIAACLGVSTQLVFFKQLSGVVKTGLRNLYIHMDISPSQ